MNHPMIDVDGEQKHRHNSEGKPIHATDEGIKNFHKWFGDSKIVDEHGRPKVMYHGTNYDFDEFRPSGDVKAIFASPEKTEAGNFAKARGANLMPIYLKSTNPHKKTVIADEEVPHAEKVRKKGFDSMQVVDSWKDNYHNTAVFHPSQVKSALGNKGDFSMKSNKITESKYRSFIDFINEEGEAGGTVAVDASPTPIANTTKNFVNPNNKKLMPSILHRPKTKTLDAPDSNSDMAAVMPKISAIPQKINTLQKYS